MKAYKVVSHNMPETSAPLRPFSDAESPGHAAKKDAPASETSSPTKAPKATANHPAIPAVPSSNSSSQSPSPSSGHKTAISSETTSAKNPPERSHSASSTTDAKETIDGPMQTKIPAPNPIDKTTPRAQSAPGAWNNGPPPQIIQQRSDSISIVSLSSTNGFDSLGVSSASCATDSKSANAGGGSPNLVVSQSQPPLQLPLNVAAATLPSTAMKPPLTGKSYPQPQPQPQQQQQQQPQQDTAQQQKPNVPQHYLEQGQQHVVHQTQQLLVAVPFQQTSGGEIVHPQQVQQQQVGVGVQDYPQQQYAQHQQAQQQQTVYYHIPGVVALPMGTTQDAQGNIVAAGGQRSHAVPQQVNHAQPGAGHQQQQQVIGMVGAIPIVKIQAPTHFVKKKKGRFNFLQETPTGAAATNGTPAVVGGAVTSPNGAVPPSAQGPATAGANKTTAIPNNITIPSQGQSMSSSVSQLSAVGPQTFDGTSAPTIKKKGRFVVTNVKDPGSIPRTMQPPQPGKPPITPVENHQHQQQKAPLQHQHQNQQQNQQSIQLQNQQANQSQQPNQQVLSQHERSSSNILPQSAVLPQHERSASSNIPLTIDIQPVQQQPGTYQAPELASGFVYTTPAVLHQQPVYQLRQTIVQPNLVQAPIPSPLTDTQPGLGNSGNSPRRSQPVTSSLPNTSMPKAPQNAEKPKVPNGGSKKKLTRTGKLPQRIDSKGNMSTVGLGKLSYFLDQMKMEVTEADQMIKTLQTDLKVLRDKNKELEAKNSNLDQKVKEERTLREKTEAKNFELRKRLREGKIEAPLKKPQDQAKGETRPPAGPPEKPAVAVAKNDQTPAQSTPVKTMSAQKQAPDSYPKSDTTQRDDASTKDPIARHGRSNSDEQESDIMSLKRAPTDTSLKTDVPVPASPAKIRPVVQARNNGMPSVATPPQSRPPVRPIGPNGAPPPKSHCVSDFDPLKPTMSAASPIAGDSVHVISIPTPVSLEVPINSASPLFQNANGQIFSANNSHFSAQFDQGTLVSENPLFVQLGMTPGAGQSMGTGYQQPSVANGAHGLQQQSFMVFPQQQPIMFQQVAGVQQVPHMHAGQFANTVHGRPSQYPNGQFNPQAVQHQAGLAYTLDSFGADPFDELVKNLPKS